MLRRSVVVLGGVLGFVLVACGDTASSEDNNAAAGSSVGTSGASGGGAAGQAGANTNTAGSGGGGAAAAGAAGAAGALASAGAGGMAVAGAGGSAGASNNAGAAGAAGNANGTAMSFFVSSVPPSGTGDLGGVEGADAYCQELALAAGAVRTQWVAYLSVMEGNINAKDRIGAGPWYNYSGDVFAADQAALHELPAIIPDDIPSRDGYIAVKPADALFMDENGDAVPGGVHDILTGSNPDGTLLADRTCNDWTSSAATDFARLGHSDTPMPTMFSPSWNSAHDSTGCDAEELMSTGGEGRIYCFATD